MKCPGMYVTTEEQLANYVLLLGMILFTPKSNIKLYMINLDEKLKLKSLIIRSRMIRLVLPPQKRYSLLSSSSRFLIKAIWTVHDSILVPLSASQFWYCDHVSSTSLEMRIEYMALKETLGLFIHRQIPSHPCLTLVSWRGLNCWSSGVAPNKWGLTLTWTHVYLWALVITVQPFKSMDRNASAISSWIVIMKIDGYGYPLYRMWFDNQARRNRLEPWRNGTVWCQQLAFHAGCCRLDEILVVYVYRNGRLFD